MEYPSRIASNLCCRGNPTEKVDGWVNFLRSHGISWKRETWTCQCLPNPLTGSSSRRSTNEEHVWRAERVLFTPLSLTWKSSSRVRDKMRATTRASSPHTAAADASTASAAAFAPAAERMGISFEYVVSCHHSLLDLTEPSAHLTEVATQLCVTVALGTEQYSAKQKQLSIIPFALVASGYVRVVLSS